MAYHTQEELSGLGEQIKNKAVSITAGKEYDTAKAAYAPDPRNPAQMHAASHIPTREEVRAQAEKAYADIPDLFSYFATPNPAKSQPMIDDLWVVSRALRPNPDVSSKNGKISYPVPKNSWLPSTSFSQRTGQLSNHLRHWDGDAADAFEQHFVSAINPAVELQGWLASGLALTLDAHREIRDRFHTDIWTLGENTLKVLDSLDDFCGPNGAQTTLSVFTAIASVLLAVPTDGVSLVGLLTLGKEGAGLASTAMGAVPKKNRTAQIDGATVDAVIKSMRSAIHTLSIGVDDQERDLANVINAISSQVDQEHRQFEVPKPADVSKISGDSRNELDRGHEFYDR